jgi:hypothetical protein
MSNPTISKADLPIHHYSLSQKARFISPSLLPELSILLSDIDSVLIFNGTKKVDEKGETSFFVRIFTKHLLKTTFMPMFWKFVTFEQSLFERFLFLSIPKSGIFAHR